MVLLGLLPILLLVLLSGTVGGNRVEGGERFLFALVVWGALIVGFTEGLSLFRLLRPTWIIAIWLLSTVVLATALVSRRAGHLDMPRALRDWYAGQPWLATGILAVCIVALAIGLVSPPNNYDSMTYHMARVMNWIENESVAHYSTDIPRQLFMPPFAEFAVLNFQMLAAADRFANVVQWLAMVGCLVSVSLIAGQLGAGRRGQVFAVAFTATIPSGIIQSTTTQTDYVAALWIVIGVYFLLLDREADAAWYKIGAGTAVGLAVLTKQTAYLFLLPFLIWYFVAKLRQRPRAALAAAGIVVVLVGALNAGHYVRNLRWAGSPLGPRQLVANQSNPRYGVDVTLSNLSLNLAAHLGTRKAWNERVKEVLLSSHDRLGIDVSDPAIRATDFRVRRVNTHEDHLGNLLHSVLIVVSIGVILASRRLRRQANLPLFVALIAASFILFSTYLTWDPFRARLHLPLFVLSAPAVGIALERVLRRPVGEMLCFGLLAAALPWLLAMENRPLLQVRVFTSGHPSILSSERISQYFQLKRSWEREFRQAAAVLHLYGRPCKTVGIVSRHADWEYPLWVLLKRYDEEYRLVHPDARYKFSSEPVAACARVYVGEAQKRMYLGHGEVELYRGDYVAVVGRLPPSS